MVAPLGSWRIGRIVHRIAPHLLLRGSGLFERDAIGRPGSDVGSAMRQSGPCRSTDRFDELAGSLGGFYTSWAAYLGLELGLFDRIRDAGPGGIPPDELALASRCLVEPVEAWVRLADAVELVVVRRQAGPRDRRGDDDPPRQRAARVPRRPVRVDGREQPRLRAAGRVLPDRPDDPRAAAAVPPGDRGGHGPGHRRVLPGGAGGAARAGGGARRRAGGSSTSPAAAGRWLIAVARRFPETTLVGVEFESDSVGRALRHVAEAGLGERIAIENRDPASAARSTPSSTSSTSRTRCTSCPIRWPPCARPGRRSGRAAGSWSSTGACRRRSRSRARSTGRCCGGSRSTSSTRARRIWDLAGYLAQFADAGVPAPAAIDLPSGATLFAVTRPG